MTIMIAQLDEYLRANGIPLVSVRQAADGSFSAVLDATATAAHVAFANAACATPPAPTHAQVMAQLAVPSQVLAALLLKSSPTTFAALTPAQQAAVQAAIDAAAAGLAAKLP